MPLYKRLSHHIHRTDDDFEPVSKLSAQRLMPADIFDSQVFVATEADHSVMAVTDMELLAFPSVEVLSVLSGRSAPALAFWWATVQEGAVGDNTDFNLPLTQNIVDDALGLSHIHVNRVLRRFIRENLIGRDHSWLLLIDRDRPAEIGEFDPPYLHLESAQPLRLNASMLEVRI